MKKISTLIIVCVALATSSIAQWRGNGNGNNNNRDNDRYGNYNTNDNRYYDFRTEAELFREMKLTRQQERRIDRINDEYRDKIFRIQNNRWISVQQKRAQLERLEQQRRREIANVLSSFQRNRYDGWCARNGNNAYGNGRW